MKLIKMCKIMVDLMIQYNKIMFLKILQISMALKSLAEDKIKINYRESEAN